MTNLSPKPKRLPGYPSVYPVKKEVQPRPRGAQGPHRASTTNHRVTAQKVCSSSAVVARQVSCSARLGPSLGVREAGYDNGRGKGDHRHFQGAETAYAFTSVEQLVADFWSDVRLVPCQMSDAKITVGGATEKEAVCERLARHDRGRLIYAFMTASILFKSPLATLSTPRKVLLNRRISGVFCSVLMNEIVLPASHPFAGIAEKLNRSNENIRNLEAEIAGFFENSEYPLLSNDNKQLILEAVEYHRKHPIPPRNLLKFAAQ